MKSQFVSPSRWTSVASAEHEVHQLPPKPALENQHKCNMKPSSNSQADSARQPISGVFLTLTKEREFDNFHIWHVASFIKANFDGSLICSLHWVSGGSWMTTCFAFVVSSSRWITVHQLTYVVQLHSDYFQNGYSLKCLIHQKYKTVYSLLFDIFGNIDICSIYWVTKRIYVTKKTVLDACHLSLM